jgi:uncharacterized membrane-anchored protein
LARCCSSDEPPRSLHQFGIAALIAAKSSPPFLYWAVIVATTTAGTTMADLRTARLGIGYPGRTPQYRRFAWC